MRLLDDVLERLPALQEAGATSIVVREGNQSVRLTLKPAIPAVETLPNEPEAPKTKYDHDLEYMMRRSATQ